MKREIAWLLFWPAIIVGIYKISDRQAEPPLEIEIPADEAGAAAQRTANVICMPVYTPEEQRRNMGLKSEVRT